MNRALLVTAYSRSDPTIAGLQAAEYLNMVGYRVEIFAVGPRAKVSDYWDKRAARKADLPFVRVIKEGFDTIIWTAPPDEDSFLRARKATSRNYLLASWDQLPNIFKEMCEAFDGILCPSWAAYEHFKHRWKIKSAYYLPWSVSHSCPLLDERARPLGDVLKLFWPLYGWQAYRHEPSIYQALSDFLRDNPNASVTAGTSINTKLKKNTALYRLCSLYPSRFKIFQHHDRASHTVELAKHDLCMWPSLFESFGFEGLTSLCAGVPVVAFNNRPSNEFVRDQNNGLVVEAELDSLGNDVPIVKPDYKKYFEFLSKLLSRPKEIMAFRSRAHIDLDKRAALHNASWERALK